VIVALAALLTFASVGVAFAVSFIQNQTGAAPQWLNPGWRFTALSDTGGDHIICMEVLPESEPDPVIEPDPVLTGRVWTSCDRVSDDPATGYTTWTCDLFTSGVPERFQNTTVKYQFWRAEEGATSECWEDYGGFTGFGGSGTNYGNIYSNINFVTGATGAPVPLAVQLAGFSATAGNGHVRVAWETVSEQGNQGFNLLRGTSAEAPERQLNETLIASEAPESSEGYSYEWVDTEVQAGTTYYYWLETVDTSGMTNRTGPVRATYEAPTSITLGGLGASSRTVLPWWAGAAGLAVVAMIGLRLRQRRG
jgi:hypothetical protein